MDPRAMETKRGMELLAGCVLARTFEHLDVYLPNILLPMKHQSPAPPTLGELIADNSLHLDDDVDLYLKNQDGTAHPVQVTRLEEHHHGLDLLDGLIILIGKKTRRLRDDDLILGVLVDLDGQADLEKLRDSVHALPVPFGYVFLLGQMGLNPQLGQFSSQMVYPSILRPIAVQLAVVG